MEERLQKYMARCGVASRRKCEELITEGKVTVNGTVVTELGVKVLEGRDIVTYNGLTIKPEEELVYIMLNKPEGYITSNSDERGRKTILDLVNIDKRIFPIGRLDYDSSGLLLLTNDGEIYNKIIHPRVNLNKTYVALVKGIFTEEESQKFRTGVDIGGYVTADAEIKILEKYKESSKILVTIHEGKNRQIRKMCSALNHEVVALKRISIGDLKLNNLEKGKWRFLTKEEVVYLNAL